jgi:uncharacterized protein
MRPYRCTPLESRTPSAAVAHRDETLLISFWLFSMQYASLMARTDPQDNATAGLGASDVSSEGFMDNFSLLSWVVCGLSAFLIGLSKTGLPGVGILSVLLAAFVIPARASTGLVLPMLIVGDLFAVSYYHRHAVWRHLVMLLPFAVVGVVIGYFAMGFVDDKQLGKIIGGIVLVLLCVNALWTRVAKGQDAVPSGWWFAGVLGLLAGVTTMMANAAGPIMIIYLLAMRLPKEEFVGTGAWYFLIVNCFKVPFSWTLGLITLSSLKFNLMLCPLVVLGALVGIPLFKRIPQKYFKVVVEVLAAAAALKLLLLP